MRTIKFRAWSTEASEWIEYNVFGLGDRLRNEACAKPVLGGEANS